MSRCNDESNIWIEQLLDAGWTKYAAGTWRSPEGRLYRGPYRAWQIMKDQSEEDMF